MNLLFGGSLASLMRPHLFRRIGPVQLVRSMLRQNILCNYYAPYKDFAAN